MITLLIWLLFNGAAALCITLAVQAARERDYMDVFIFTFAALSSIGCSALMVLKMAGGLT